MTSGVPRQAFAFPAMVLTASAAGLLALAIIASASSRARDARMHQARVQGREWCLGARMLAISNQAASNLAVSHLEIGAWKIQVEPTHTVSAVGPLGTYRIAADGSESWTRAMGSQREKASAMKATAP